MLAVPVPATMGQVEIRIELDRIEPLAARLRVMPYPELATGEERDGDAGAAGNADRGVAGMERGVAGIEHGERQPGQIRFAGWLGLLRVLYEVAAAGGTVPPPETQAGPPKTQPEPPES